MPQQPLFEDRRGSAAGFPDEQQRLAALHRYDVLDSDSESGFDEIAELAAAICGTPIALVSLVDENRQWFKCRIGLDVAETPRDMAFCDRTIRGTGLMEVQDAAADDRFSDNPLVTGEPHIRFYAGVPLVTPDGHALGTLCVIDRRPRELSPSQRRALVLFSRQVMLQLETRRALREIRRDEQRRQMAERDIQQLNDALSASVRLRRAELAAMEGELAEVAARHRLLFSNSAVGVATVDADGRIVEVNPAFGALCGCAEPDLLGEQMMHCFDGELVGLSELVDEVLAGNVPWLSREMQLRRPAAEPLWVSVSLFAVAGTGDTPVRGLLQVMDIASRKHAEMERDHFFELSADMFAIVDYQGQLLRLNPACWQALGVGQGDLLGHGYRDYLHPADLAQTDRALDGLVDRDRRDTGRAVLRFRHGDGSYRSIEWSGARWAGEGRLILVGHDVTEAMERERRLHALAARLQEVREAERTRISREIHDDLGQRLTALKMTASLLLQDVADPEVEQSRVRQGEDLHSMLGMIDRTLTSVRRIARELRPEALDSLGLTAALETHVLEAARHAGLQCQLDIDEQAPEPTGEVATAVFRIIQEADTNVLRHAEAKQLNLSLEFRGSGLRVTVRDDGQGFDVDARASNSLGVLGMFERAVGIGAELEVRSREGGGTTVTLDTPLAPGVELAIAS